MNTAEQVIKEYVNQFEKKFGGDTNYKKYLANMNKIKLEVITEDDVKRVIQPFLYDWGGSAHVLGRKEFPNWQTNIVQPIKSNSEKLTDFKKRNLLNVKLGEYRPLYLFLRENDTVYNNVFVATNREGGHRLI